jgi:tripartite-type tricarboxylate transporter receptor subunit TctC
MSVLRKIGTLLTATLAAVSIAGSSGAQSYPNRTITLIVPFPAGGLSDVAARAVALELQKRLGQTVVVENKTGASGTVGGAYVARAAPDGYTLLVNAPADVTNPHFMQVPYNALKDFSPIGMIVKGPPLALVVNPSLPYRTLQDLIADARAKPGKLSFGSSGLGTSPSIAIRQLQSAGKIDVVDVPYRGVSLAVLGVIAGEIQASFVFLGSAKPAADEGKVRALALTSEERNPVLPLVPTMIESGFPGFVHDGFVGLAAPANTSPEVIKLLNAHLNAIVIEPAFRERFAKFGMQPYARNSPEEFASYLRLETEKYDALARLSK